MRDTPSGLAKQTVASMLGAAAQCTKDMGGAESDTSSTSSTSGDFPQGKLIIFEGNIGAGKTTMAREMAKRLNCKLFLEPTVQNPYLSLFYADPKKYALKLQLWIYRQRFHTITEAVRHILETGQSVILDRSAFSDIVFADANVNDGNITHEGYKFYMDLRKRTLGTIPAPHLTLYLNVCPKVCAERILARSRDCEGGIPVEYLENLDGEYKRFLRNIGASGSPILSIDWNEFGDMEDVAQSILSQDMPSWRPEEMERISDFVFDTKAIELALSSPYMIPDAMLDEFAHIACSTEVEEEASKEEMKSSFGQLSSAPSLLL